MKKIILIPVYNEKKNTAKLFLRIKKSFKSDLLYINDNSTDGTTEVINKLVITNEYYTLSTTPLIS